MKRSIRTHTIDAQAVNLFLSMENGANGAIVTTTILDNATVGSGGTWVLSPSPVTQWSVSTAFDGGALLRGITVGGTPYTGGGGTRSFVYDHAVDDDILRYSVTTNSQVVSAGFWLKTDLHNADANARQIDLFYIIAGSVSAVVQFSDAPGSGSDGLRAHGSSPILGSTFGATIPISANTAYWVSLQFDSVSGYARVNVYTSSGVPVGSTSNAAIDTGGAVTLFRMIGDTHGQTSATHSYFDNLIVDWTTGAFPLGVPS